MQDASFGTWTLRRIAAAFMCPASMWTRSPSKMSRDFSPDLESSREVVREAREKPQETHRSEPGRASGQRDEGRTLSRLPEVQKSRPREVPSRESRTVLYDRYRSYDLRESEVQTLAD